MRLLTTTSRRRSRSTSWLELGEQPLAADRPVETVQCVPPRLRRAGGRRPGRGQRAAVGDDSTEGEAAILHAFADLSALTPERRPLDDDDDQRAPREHFNHYLRSLDVEREGIPTWFAERLARAVAHYGIDEPRRRLRSWRTR